MVVSVILYPVLYGLELFLASALITQIAVSLAAVVVSTVTIYFCRQKLVYWHQERVLRRRGRWLSDVSIRSSRKPKDGDHSESSESDLGDHSLLRRLRAGLRSRSHDRSKSRTTREGLGEGILKSYKGATSDESKKGASDSGRVRPKLTKQVGAMHRSHWVAKPQQSHATTGVQRRSSDSDADLRGRGAVVISDRLVHEDPSGTDLSKVLKRSRATTQMALKKHPQLCFSGSSSSSASPASSSAESDDFAHAAESIDKVEVHPDTAVQTRRVPSIQVEPIVEERIVPLGRHAPSPTSAEEAEESTGTEISTLVFQFQIPVVSVSADEIATTSAETSSADTADASKTEQTTKDVPEISDVPVIYASDATVHEGHESVDEPTLSTEKTAQPRQDSLGVPPVLAGEETYPEPAVAPGWESSSASVWVSEIAFGSSQRPLVLEPEMDLDGDSPGDNDEMPSFNSSLTLPPTAHDPPLLGEVKVYEGKTMDSLDVPPTITGELCFPSLMFTQKNNQADQDSGEQAAHTRKIIKIRPKSLDIPPMMPAPYQRNASSAPSSPPSHGVKRKHNFTKSILKRSGSMERPGRKKSVSFSPEVSPRGESERCYQDDADRDRRDSPKRPRVFRHFSMDIPDARIASEEDRSLSVPQIPWSHGDPDDNEHPEVFSPPATESSKLSRAEGWVHPSALEPMQIEGSDARMSFVPVLTLEVDESGRKSAKERFLEAGGPKAVLSVLCTQDSSDSNGSKYTPSSTQEREAEAPAADVSEEDSMETMPDFDQQVSVSAEIDDNPSTDEGSPLSEDIPSGQEATKSPKEQTDSKGIKTRFLEYKEDSTDLHTSRLFVQTVRSSVESDSSDETRADEADKDKKAEGEEEEDQTTSAKSRFLQSCQKVDGEDDSPSGSRFVVSVVRSYNIGCHRQDSPPDGGSKGAGPRPTREVPDGNNANTWQDVPEDIEFYTSEPKSAEDAQSTSVTMLLGDSSSSDSSESDGDGMGSGLTSRNQSDSYSTCLHHRPSYSENSAVVIDNGSEVIKVGFAGDLKPRYTLPCVVGRYPTGKGSASTDAERTTYIGDEAAARSSLLSFSYPSSEGVVDNWEDLEKVWEHVFSNVLAVSPQEHPILLSEYASTRKKQREKCAEILFETLQVPSLCLVNQGALALHSQGETAGIVLSSGGGLTEVIPVLDGCTMQYAVTTLKIAGRHVTRHLGDLLRLSGGYDLTSPDKIPLLRDIKETLAYVCMDFGREIHQVRALEPLEYKLPDGSSMTVGHRELVQCTEHLFQPSLGGCEAQTGIHDMIQETLKRCNPTVLAGIRKSILLAGGNTQLRGFGDRLQRELVSAHLPWSVSMPQERTHSVWVGGSVVAAHGDFSRRCVTADEYAEHGAPAVHAKCF